MINKLKRTVALVLSFLMLISIIPISAVKGNTQANEVQVFKIDPAAFDWEGGDASWIDFSKISEEIPVSGTVKGDGLNLITTESTGNTRASNTLENGYMLLGKGARVNDNPEDMATKPTVTGAIYIKLDKALAEKQETPYIVKVDYYGGNMAEDDAVNGGSYIDLRYNSLTSANSSTRNVYNTSWQANADQTMYFELPKADFSENIGTSAADFRLETWTGARLRIKRISVIPYTPENIPEMTTVDAVKEPVIADFSTLNTTADSPSKNTVLTENLVGSGITLLTGESTGSQRGSNIVDDGYGFNWKAEPNPSFSMQDEEIHRIYDPRLTVIDNQCYICFAMDTRHGLRGGIAKTDDFKSLDILALTVPDNRNMVLFPEKIDDKYIRLERPMPVYSRGGDRFDIWLSKSPDLKYWGESELVLATEQVPFANDKIGPAAPPIKTKYGWLTTFHAVEKDEGRGKHGWEPSWKKIYYGGIMLLDLNDPSKVLGVYDKPLIAPELPHETEEGFRTDVIFPGGMILEDNGEVKIYYGASDTVECVAVAQVDDLVNLCLGKN